MGNNYEKIKRVEVISLFFISIIQLLFYNTHSLLIVQVSDYD